MMEPSPFPYFWVPDYLELAVFQKIAETATRQHGRHQIDRLEGVRLPDNSTVRINGSTPGSKSTPARNMPGYRTRIMISNIPPETVAHTHHPSELWTAILYLQDHDDPLELLKPKGAVRETGEKPRYVEADWEVCASIPAKANTLVFFNSTPISYHRVRPGATQLRRLLTLVGETV